MCVYVCAYFELLSVIGTPFYLMRYVPGQIFKNPALPGLLPNQRKVLYIMAVTSLLWDINFTGSKCILCGLLNSLLGSHLLKRGCGMVCMTPYLPVFHCVWQPYWVPQGILYSWLLLPRAPITTTLSPIYVHSLGGVLIISLHTMSFAEVGD